MNRDDIIRMAREADIKLSKDVWPWEGTAEESVEHFAKLVAAAEREACARVCEDADNEAFDKTGCPAYGSECAAAIRARGEE